MLKLSVSKHTNEDIDPTINKTTSKIINEMVKTHRTKAAILETKIQTLALTTIKTTISIQLVKATIIGVTIVKAIKTAKINPIRPTLRGQTNSAKRKKNNAKTTICASFVVSPVIVLTYTPIRQKTSSFDADLHFV